MHFARPDAYDARLSRRDLARLTDLIVKARNEVVRESKRKKQWWSLMCTAFEVARDELESRSEQGSWLEFTAEQGLAYTIQLNGYPLRVLSPHSKKTKVLAGERALRKKLHTQVRMRYADNVLSKTCLRLEVSHRRGGDVDAVRLLRVEEHSGTILDDWMLYQASPAGAADAANAAAASSSPAKRPDAKQLEPAHFDVDSHEAEDTGTE